MRKQRQRIRIRRVTTLGTVIENAITVFILAAVVITTLYLVLHSDDYLREQKRSFDRYGETR